MKKKRSDVMEPDVTEIDERIATERERAARLQRGLDCVCPEAECPVDHDN